MVAGSTSVPSFKLNNGVLIPSVALGTWQSKPGEVEHAVEFALKEGGYRHIDGAYAYRNEQEVGEGVRKSGVPRSEIFLTSKVWCTKFKNVEECLDETLKDLGTDYVDLYLIHWPIALKNNDKNELIPRRADGTRDADEEVDVHSGTWKQMEAIYKKGKARAIGVSNYSKKTLEKLFEVAEIVPAVNQVELHPYLPQDGLKEYCESKGILLQAYSPLGSTDSNLIKDEDVSKIAKKHGVEPAQVLVSWQVQRNVIVLPKSVTPSRIAKNIQIVTLDAEDMKVLNGLHVTKGKRFVRPDWPVDLGFDDWRL